MANTSKGTTAQHPDWFAEFPEEQSLLLDPPTMAVPQREAAGALAENGKSRPRVSGLAAVAVMLHWLVGRVA